MNLRKYAIAALILGAAGLWCFATSAQNKPSSSDAGLIAKARLIHQDVLKLDTHNDIEPSNFTPDCNYTMRLAPQVNLPKMIEGGMDVSFMIV